MSARDDATDPAVTGILPPVQSVGYGKPPVQHRFQKGQSRNPEGQTAGSKVRQAPEFNPADQLTSRMILAEAYRSMRTTGFSSCQAIQAVMRAMSVSAMKGNRLAQKTLAETVRRVEAEESARSLAN